MRRYELAAMFTSTTVSLAQLAGLDPTAGGLMLSQGMQSTQGGVPSPSQPTQPGQHPQQQPDQPSTTPNGNPNPIGLEGNAANGTPATRTTNAGGERWDRPFALQTPQSEARLAEVGRRLYTMEQRMARDNAEMLRRIGEARQMTGEKQSKAVLDILQQMAQDQAELQRYLVATRTAWAGDSEPMSGAVPTGTTATPGGAGPRQDIDATPTTPRSPSTTPPSTPGGATGTGGTGAGDSGTGSPGKTNPPR